MSGNLEQLVLLAILRLGPEAYCARICAEIANNTSHRTSPPAIYTTLARMERKGYVTSSWVRVPTRRRGCRSRRCYVVSPEALRLLTIGLKALQRMAEGVELPRDLSYRSTHASKLEAALSRP